MSNETTVLITGGTGFVGRHVAGALLAAGKRVRILARQTDSPVARRLQARGAEVHRGDVGDPASIRRAIVGADAVVHLVAIIRERGNATFTDVNYRGTLNALDSAQAARVTRFIHFSALGADPSSPYPYLRSKGFGEEAVKLSGLAYTIVRPSVIFGAGDEFLTLLAAVAKALPATPIVGDGSNRLQPVWVEDVAAAANRIVDDRSTVGHSYDLGGPEVLTYRQLLELVRQTLGARGPTVSIPIGPVSTAARLLERVVPEPPVTPGVLSLLRIDNVAPTSATADLIGRRPTPVAGQIDYVRRVSYWQAVRALLGFGLPRAAS